MTPTTKKTATVKKRITRKKTVRKAVRKKTETVAAAPVAEVEQPKRVVKKHVYLFAAGRRKSSVARVRLMLKETGVMTVNGKPLDKYFTHQTYRRIVQEPLVHTNTGDLGVISVKVQGGGPRGQADSIRLGISRVLLKHDESLRPLLKSKKLLSVDSRVKERKKYGLKKARRAPQWQKR